MRNALVAELIAIIINQTLGVEPRSSLGHLIPWVTDHSNVIFPETAVNMTSGPFPLEAQNETNEIVGVNSIQIDPPDGFAIQTAIPTSVNPNAILSLAFTFTPTQVRDYVSIIRVRAAGPRQVILLSAQLTGKCLFLPPPPVISSFSPLAAEIGETVSIFGSNLGGATIVRLGTLGTSFMVVNDTEIEADVTGPRRLAPITVTTASGTAVSSGLFRVIFVRPHWDEF